MKVEMHRSPMTLELAAVIGDGCWLGPRRLLKKAKLDVEAMQDGNAGHRPGLLGEAERAAVEGHALREARYVDADRNGNEHWFLCRRTLAISCAATRRCEPKPKRRLPGGYTEFRGDGSRGAASPRWAALLGVGLPTMSKAAERLLESALKLDLPERAELAAELLASLDGAPDEDAQAAWAAEIERRAARARSGDDARKPWPEVRDRIRAA